MKGWSRKGTEREGENSGEKSKPFSEVETRKFVESTKRGRNEMKRDWRGEEKGVQERRGAGRERVEFYM